MMPLPEGTYAQRNRSRTLHSSRKTLSRLLRKAVSLSVRISVGGPRSWKSTFSWLITLVASCRGRRRQMANRAGLQSITVKKWAPLQWVISIATRCHVCLTFKAPFDQCTGTGSIDWHSSHSLTKVFTAALETPGQSVSRNKVSAAHQDDRFVGERS